MLPRKLPGTACVIMARQAGLFVGVSGGAAVVASIAVAQVEQGNVVTILPDDGSKYVSLGIFA